MKKIAFLALLSISASLFSQNVIGTSTAPENKWTFGGGIGFGFGSNSTFNLQASPRVGYRITDNLEGGITGTVVDVRLIFKIALEQNATSIILTHNHPSGKLMASDADKEVTKKLKLAGDQLDVKVLDHIIITEKSYLSFQDEGIF